MRSRSEVIQTLIDTYIGTSGKLTYGELTDIRNVIDAVGDVSLEDLDNSWFGYWNDFDLEEQQEEADEEADMDFADFGEEINGDLFFDLDDVDLLEDESVSLGDWELVLVRKGSSD